MFKTFLVFYVSVIGICFAQTSPVFLWGSPSQLEPAIRTIDQDSFSALISPRLSDSMILVFLEKGLKTEDIALCKTDAQESCFQNLKEFKNSNYYADVEMAVNTLKNLKSDQQFVNLNNKGVLSKAVPYKIGKVVFITLDNTIENRKLALIEHDSAIAKVYNTLSKEGNILAIYTSEPTYLKRTQRQAKPSNAKHRSFETKGKFRAVFKSCVIQEDGKDPTEINFSKMTANLDNTNNNKITVTMSGDQNLIFDVIKSAGYWKISELKLGDDIFNTSIIAAETFSYSCGTNTFQSPTAKGKLIFKGLKIQPNYGNSDTLDFNNTQDCIGFTSPGIWMGVLVTFMFLFIISIGITWLMDINTMDRFDDPKGKTITIGATD